MYSTRKKNICGTWRKKKLIRNCYVLLSASQSKEDFTILTIAVNAFKVRVISEEFDNYIFLFFLNKRSNCFWQLDNDCCLLLLY